MLQDQSRNRTSMPTVQPPAGDNRSDGAPASTEAGIARMLSGPAVEAPSPDSALLSHSQILDDLAARAATAMYESSRLEGVAYGMVGASPPPFTPEAKAWTERLEAALDACGHTAAALNHDAVDHELQDVLRQVAGIRATTVQGLVLKARWAREQNLPEIIDSMLDDLVGGDAPGLDVAYVLPCSDLGAACIAQAARLDWLDANSGVLSEEESDAEMDRWGAVFRRAITEPSTGLGDLAGKARLMISDLGRFYPVKDHDTDNWRLMRVILAEVIRMGEGSEMPPSSIAAEVHPDSDLLDLGRRFEAAEAAYRTALRRSSEIEAALVRPAEPDAIFVAPGDEALGLSSWAYRRADGRDWYMLVSPDDKPFGLRVPRTRWDTRIATEKDNVPAGDTIARPVPWPEAQARADEVIAAYDGWIAEWEGIKAAAGLTAADELATRLGEALSKVESAIEDATARTLEGVLVKARFAQRDIDINGETQEFLIAGLVRDLLAVGTQGAHLNAPGPSLPQSAAADPALQGIAETRAALDRGIAAEAASTARGEGNLPEAFNDAVTSALAALGRIKAPTTLAGCQALARLACDMRPGLGLDLDEEMPRILELIAGIGLTGQPLTANGGLHAFAELSLQERIIAVWREWSQLPDFDESEAGQAEYNRIESLRDELLYAAEALPATLDNLPVKALAAAWSCYVGEWRNGWSREQYGLDGHLVLDIDTAICGRLKTTYSGAAA